MTDWQRALVRLLPAVAAIGAMIPARSRPAERRPRASRSSPTSTRRCRRELVLTKAGKHGHTSWRLGFRSAVRNIGDGPLIIDGRRPSAGQKTMDAEQVIVHDRRAETVVPGVGQAALRALARPPALAPARLRPLRAAARRAAPAPWSATARPASASATATRSPRAICPAKAPETVYTEPLRARAAGAARHPRGHLGRLRRRLQREPRGPVPAARRPAPRAATCSCTRSTPTAGCVETSLRQQRGVVAAAPALAPRRAAGRRPRGLPHQRAVHRRTLTTAASLWPRSEPPRGRAGAAACASRPSPPGSRSRGRSRSCPTGARS